MDHITLLKLKDVLLMLVAQQVVDSLHGVER